jgi:hypothetical protein
MIVPVYVSESERDGSQEIGKLYAVFCRNESLNLRP